METLETFIRELVDFSDEEVHIFTSLFSERNLKKNEHLAIEGEISTDLAFLLTGVMRAFYRNREGSEYNKTFFSKPGFLGAYSSLTTGNKNLINIQCLTDCTILVTRFENVVTLYNNYPKVERLARKLAEYKFSIKEKREIELVTLDASQRYEIFKKDHPDLENKIPQYHIASYLGVSPTQLSRIRRNR